MRDEDIDNFIVEDSRSFHQFNFRCSQATENTDTCKWMNDICG